MIYIVIVIIICLHLQVLFHDVDDVAVKSEPPPPCGDFSPPTSVVHH